MPSPARRRGVRGATARGRVRRLPPPANHRCTTPGSGSVAESSVPPPAGRPTSRRPPRAVTGNLELHRQIHSLHDALDAAAQSAAREERREDAVRELSPVLQCRLRSGEPRARDRSGLQPEPCGEAPAAPQDRWNMEPGWARRPHVRSTARPARAGPRPRSPTGDRCPRARARPRSRGSTRARDRIARAREGRAPSCPSRAAARLRRRRESGSAEGSSLVSALSSHASGRPRPQPRRQERPRGRSWVAEVARATRVGCPPRARAS